MKYVQLLKILVATFCMAVALTGVQAAIKLDDPVPLSPLLRKGQLPNGLTYYIQKNDKPAKQVELRLVVKAGSVLEDDDQQGLAHFTEHMAFNGSTHFKGNALVSFLQSIGMRFGADLNAYTGFDETVYILSVPTDKPGNLERAFLVLQDWAGGLAFDAVAIDKERGVVLEESRRGKGAEDRLGKITLPKVLEGSKYALRLPIGHDDIIQSFPRAAVKRFYDDWYRPNLMAVMVVGNIDPVRAQALVKKHFGGLKNPVHERPRPVEKLPARTVQEAVVATDKEATNNLVSITYSRQEDGPENTWGAYRQHMVENLLNQMLGLRLQELTLTANPPFVAGSSGLQSLIKGYREFNASALVGKPGVEPAIRALVEENERAAQFGFTEAELARSKKNYARDMEQYFKERSKTESPVFADEFVRNFLTDEPIPGIAAEARAANDMLPGITLQEVSLLARQLINGSNHKLLIYQGVDSEDAAKPTGQDLLDIVAKAAATPVKAYAEKTMARGLMPQLPKSGTVVSEKTMPALGLTEWTLSNGVQVVLKPTDFKNDQILMGAYRAGGLSLFPDADLINGSYAVPVVSEMGLADFSPNDLRKLLAGKAVSAGPQLGDISEGFGGQAGNAELETLLQLTHLFFTQPRRDETLFMSFVGKSRDMLKNAEASPEVRFSEAIQKAVYGDHPRRPRIPKSQDFDQLDLGRAMDIYRARFGSAKGFTFFFVGSLDTQVLKPLVARYLGSLPVADVPTQFRDLGLRPVKGAVRSAVLGGTEAKSILSLTLTGDAAYSNSANMAMRAMVDVLDIKLVEVLREKMGAVYSPSLSAQFSKLPYGHYTINLTVPSSPDNVDKIVDASLAEMQKLKDQGPQAGDLAKVKENWIKNFREAVKTNGYWLSVLRSSKEQGEDPARVLRYEARVKALTAADVQQAARQYIDTQNMVQLVLNPVKS